MPLDWSAVREHFAAHPSLPSLAGTSTVRVTGVDDERVCLSQRLWKDCISRRDLDAAVDLLAAGRLDPEPMAFAEGLRRHWSSRADGRPVETGCTRGPNLAAVVLSDLGYLARPDR